MSPPSTRLTNAAPDHVQAGPFARRRLSVSGPALCTVAALFLTEMEKETSAVEGLVAKRVFDAGLGAKTRLGTVPPPTARGLNPRIAHAGIAPAGARSGEAVRAVGSAQGAHRVC